MTRSLSIRKRILEVLERSEPYALPESQLTLELNGHIRPPAGQAEFDEEILSLKSKRAIATVPDSLDETNVKWIITEIGKSLLRQ